MKRKLSVCLLALQLSFSAFANFDFTPTGMQDIAAIFYGHSIRGYHRGDNNASFRMVFAVHCLERREKVCQRMKFYEGVDVKKERGVIKEVTELTLELSQKDLQQRLAAIASPEQVISRSLHRVTPGMNITNATFDKLGFALLMLFPVLLPTAVGDILTSPFQYGIYRGERALMKDDVRDVHQRLKKFVMSGEAVKPERITNNNAYGALLNALTPLQYPDESQLLF